MKAYAKANIFLKLTGFDSRKYHLLESRFILLKDLLMSLSLLIKNQTLKKNLKSLVILNAKIILFKRLTCYFLEDIITN